MCVLLFVRACVRVCVQACMHACMQQADLSIIYCTDRFYTIAERAIDTLILT